MCALSVCLFTCLSVYLSVHVCVHVCMRVCVYVCVYSHSDLAQPLVILYIAQVSYLAYLVILSMCTAQTGSYEGSMLCVCMHRVSSKYMTHMRQEILQ